MAAGDVRFELWVCRGRLCTANGSDGVCAAVETAIEAAPPSSSTLQVLRGGCYGLCELGPNVIVRRFGDADESTVDADRLTLTGKENEVVYCGVGAADAQAIVDSHVVADEPLARLTRDVRAAELEPRTPIERRMRDLRVARERRRGTP